MSTDVFHYGERAMQMRVGAHERLAVLGAKVIRSFLPEQHREFFRQLPFVVVGSLDDSAQPWGSMLAGPPGFIASPDPRRLEIHALPILESPLSAAFAEGMSIGLLGIEPHTRRRNRLNGIVSAVSAERFAVDVHQSFGNCPKYIQARQAVFTERSGAVMDVVRGAHLDENAKALIETADTFFIATAHPAAAQGRDHAHGVDVSHRGGRPGFVRIDDDKTLLVPDFAGNNFFNTLGNLLMNPKAGLLFADYANGDLLHIAADAQIIEQGPEVAAFAGAQRLLRLRVRETQLVPRALPLTWGSAESSPFLAATGHW